ncbi:hypothetical protein HO133_000237 [Letharia lupina]|uniref:Uncharacterized protein n=1 Tax=Letharia lupina TaxID=560253 RepID=A0A8H6CGZ7_9LECA|nr:uncharacterized protein HO133_000237 [Letharia lupina]KAF6223395.1 hypothetical protein HO133_000237 [Letharia lupina]
MTYETVVKMKWLRRTWESEGWSSRAYELDLEKNIELEIRELIGKDVVNFDDFIENNLAIKNDVYNHGDSISAVHHRVSYKHGRLPTLRAARQLQRASGSSRFEFDRVFEAFERARFSKFSFNFEHHTDFKTFSDVVGAAEAKQSFRFQVHPFEPTWSIVQHKTRPQSRRKWIGAFAWLPVMHKFRSILLHNSPVTHQHSLHNLQTAPKASQPLAVTHPPQHFHFNNQSP